MQGEFDKQLLEAIDRMQAFPVSVQSILKLTRDAGAAQRELVDVIQRDPVVTVKVLRVVNSAYYSLPRHITSIDHAVVLLGFNTIKNLVLGIAVMSLASAHLQPTCDDKAFLRHSLGVAALSRQLGSRFASADANDFFIGGLLHDFGKVVLAYVMPTQFKKALEYALWHEVSLHAALVEVIGLDQAEVGASLLAHWHFPDELVQGIRHQYVLADDAPVLAQCIYAANQICKCFGNDFAASDPAQPLPAVVQSTLGGTLEQLTESLGDVAATLKASAQFMDL